MEDSDTSGSDTSGDDNDNATICLTNLGTEFVEVDAIVYAGPPRMIKGFGFSEAVLLGPRGAKMTQAFNLPAKYIIHTVAPENESTTRRAQYHLANCYRSALRLAEDERLQSVAFHPIYTGTVPLPDDEAARVAIETIKTFPTKTLERIVFSNLPRQTYDSFYYAVQNFL